MRTIYILLALHCIISCHSQEWVEVDEPAFLYPQYIETYNKGLEAVGNISDYDLIPIEIVAVTKAKYFPPQEDSTYSCNEGSFVKIRRKGKEEIVHSKDIMVEHETYEADALQLLVLREYIASNPENGCWNTFYIATKDSYGVELLQEDIEEAEDPPYLWLEQHDAMEESITGFIREGNFYTISISRELQDGAQAYKLRVSKKGGQWTAQRSELIKLGELDHNLDEIHASIIPIEQEVDRLYNLAYDDRSDKFQQRVNEYITYFKKEIRDNPEMITYPFSKLSDNYGLHIATSENNNLKFYTWNTETGGSMKYFEGLYQTRKNGIVQTHELEYGEGDPGYYVSKIHTISNGVDVYYVIIANEIYSNRNVAQTAMAYKINQDNTLVPVKLFKTKKRAYDRIPVQYNFFSAMDDHDERPIEVIKYDAFSKIFSFTLVDEKDNVTDKYLQYQWNGDAFEYIGIQ